MLERHKQEYEAKKLKRKAERLKEKRDKAARRDEADAIKRLRDIARN